MKYDKDSFFMTISYIISKQSHCVSRQVGALIVYDDRIVSMGYNGTPPGYKNCDQVFDINNFDRQKHHEWSLKNEIHAEANAIAFAAKNGISTKGSTIYITLSPCFDCAKLIISAGITTVVYDNIYIPESLEFLNENKIITRHAEINKNLLSFNNIKE